MQLFETRMCRKVRAWFTNQPRTSRQPAKLDGPPPSTQIGRRARSRLFALPGASRAQEDARHGYDSNATSRRASKSPTVRSPTTVGSCNVSDKAASVPHQDVRTSRSLSRAPMVDAAVQTEDQQEDEIEPVAALEAGPLTTDEEEEMFDDEQVVRTAEQLQEVRETNYRTFYGEDETDYTRGPSRVVLATDGVDDCTALLLTLDLSQAVQKAIEAQRQYTKARRTTKEKISALGRSKNAIKSEIRTHKSRIATMKNDEDQDKRASVEEELFYLELMVEENQMERTALENDLVWRGEKLREVQSELNALLEDWWTKAQLLQSGEDEPEAPAPAFDLATEYQEFRSRMHDADAPLTDAVPDLDTSRAHLKIQTNPEDQVKFDKSERIDKAAWNAWDRLKSAQSAFDRRVHARFEAKVAQYAAIDSGEQPDDATSEAFDIHWHHHERSLTRELIEAEEAFDAAEAAQAALHKSAENASQIDQTTAIVDDVGDGYSLSSEQEVAAAAPIPRIMAWLSGVPEESMLSPPDCEDGLELAGADEWEVEELAFGDDQSEIVRLKENSNRAKIDEWQKMREETRAEFAWMQE